MTAELHGYKNREGGLVVLYSNDDAEACHVSRRALLPSQFKSETGRDRDRERERERERAEGVCACMPSAIVQAVVVYVAHGPWASRSSLHGLKGRTGHLCMYVLATYMHTWFPAVVRVLRESIGCKVELAEPCSGCSRPCGCCFGTLQHAGLEVRKHMGKHMG